MTNGHPTRDEDFDLLALGALEGEEKQALEAHVASCADCARKLAEARGRVAMLSLAAPPVAPSAAVKQRLMAQVRGEAAAEPRPPAGREPHAARFRSRAGRFGRWWNAILVPAAVALAALTIFLWHENRALDRRLAALHASMNQQQQQLDEAREVAESDDVAEHDHRPARAAVRHAERQRARDVQRENGHGDVRRRNRARARRENLPALARSR